MVLLGLTLLAGFIRFFRLSSPCLWYDEARVYYRVCGTYGQLLECLRTDGFGPLHYELYWLIVRTMTIASGVFKWHWLAAMVPPSANDGTPVFFPGPAVLRCFPALCGTLMVPAMYFLARQLLPVKTSLLTAAITACSGFLIFYSRDAKMYMDTWLSMAAGMGSLLWWFRTNRSTAWLCWIACFSVACGIHATAFVAVALSVVLLFTQRTFLWQRFLLWLLGVAVITAGPLGYYLKFNTWKDRVSEDWHNSELEWIKLYNAGRTGPQLTRYLGTNMLMGWEWPRDANWTQIQPRRVNTPAILATTVAIILLVAAFPWPQRWRTVYATREPPPQARWRVVLWLSFWVVLPAYGFYRRSVPGFASPVDWFDTLVNCLPVNFHQLLQDHAWPWVLLGLLLIAGVFTAGLREWSTTLLLSCLPLVAVFATVILACWGLYLICAPAAKAAAAAGNPWASVWVPRYMGVIWPAAAMIVAALLLRLPTRPVRVGAIALFLGINLFFGGTRIFAQTEPPVDLMAADAFTAENPRITRLRGPIFTRAGPNPPAEICSANAGSITTNR